MLSPAYHMVLNCSFNDFLKHFFYLVIIYHSVRTVGISWLTWERRSHITLQSVLLTKLMGCITTCLRGECVINSPSSGNAVTMKNGWEMGFRERNLVQLKRKKSITYFNKSTISISTLNHFDQCNPQKYEKKNLIHLTLSTFLLSFLMSDSERQPRF